MPTREDCDGLKAAFCAALAETGIVTRACQDAGIGRATAYRWKDEDVQFSDDWAKALEIGIAALEDEAHRRAFEGVEEPVFYQGEQCGSVRKYSDTLAIFLLKSHKPAVYRENARLELTGADGGPVQLSNTERAAKIGALLAAAKERKIAQARGEVPRDDDVSDLL